MGFLRGHRLKKCPRPDYLLHYWPDLIEGMRFSTKDFYDRMEAALQARSIPELEVSRVDIKEGGPMTPRREYLRLRRERLVFDICAMPFGNGFYVSEWFWRQPRRLGLLLLVFLAAVITLGYAMWVPMPWTWPIYRFLHFKLGIFSLFTRRMILAIGVPAIALIVGFFVGSIWFGEALDGTLMRIPVFGYIYEHWLRRVTYYREDRTQAFQTAAHNALCGVIDDICKTQGIAPLSDTAKRPMHAQIKPNIGPLRRKTEIQTVG